MRISLGQFSVLAAALVAAGCGSSEATATKTEQGHYDDRNPADFHAPPPGAATMGGPPKGAGAPPTGAGGPPAGAAPPAAGGAQASGGK